jgi:beta-phosphoglucomutase-like phosphatase (HAD superfamily)
VERSSALDPSRLKSLIFDVDGTLYSQSPLRMAMLRKLLKEAVLRPGSGIKTFRALTAYRRAQELLRNKPVGGPLAAMQLRLACESSGQPEHVLAAIVTRWIEEEPLALLERFVSPALRTLLDAARSRGLRLGVLSDYPPMAKLHAMRLAEFFEVLVSAQDPAVNCFKPHPRGLVETLRRLNVHASEALYIGDRHDVDGEAARAAGVSCVVVGGRKATAAGCISVPDYSALHALLFST